MATRSSPYFATIPPTPAVVSPLSWLNYTHSSLILTKGNSQLTFYSITFIHAPKVTHLRLYSPAQLEHKSAYGLSASGSYLRLLVTTMSCKAIAEMTVDIANGDQQVVDLLACLDHPKTQASLQHLDLQAWCQELSFGRHDDDSLLKVRQLKDEQLVGHEMLEYLCSRTRVEAEASINLPALNRLTLTHVLAAWDGGFDIWDVIEEREQYDELGPGSNSTSSRRFCVRVEEDSWNHHACECEGDVCNV